MTDFDRYNRAAHCVQAGSKLDAARSGEHPQSRCGINMAMRDHASLVELLISKGVITDGEYLKAIADGAEAEVRRMEHELSAGGPTKITLHGALGSIHEDAKK